LSNQVGNFQATLPHTYAPRPEAEERHKAINERFDDLYRQLDERKANVDRRIEDMQKTFEQRTSGNSTRIERIEQRMWAIAVGSLGAIALALIDLLKPK
jgi:hypothetical protein